ncbi:MULTISPECIES: hypothetical protein [unclassified Janthinobacterium]|uniref:hypothetical protein n=1 Tax=unclassified Janthinobacterium TaxID=2610881 RepID=UPI0018CBCDFF|nr:hypothetical protein [Janthinobacterium sp. CG_23.4]MDH6157408.1 hypothetical protein [Janthinobacterium sp. CG_23.4]
MDYSKYALALQLLQLAKPEIAAAIEEKTRRTPLKTLPCDDLEAIVFDYLDQLKPVVNHIDQWAAGTDPR